MFHWVLLIWKLDQKLLLIKFRWYGEKMFEDLKTSQNLKGFSDTKPKPNLIFFSLIYLSNLYK